MQHPDRAISDLNGEIIVQLDQWDKALGPRFGRVEIPGDVRRQMARYGGQRGRQCARKI
jgi:hypothetical protein